MRAYKNSFKSIAILLLLCTLVVGQFFVDENGETETISIDGPLVEEPSLKVLPSKPCEGEPDSEGPRSKRDTSDYGSEGDEADEDGSGDNNYEDEDEDEDDYYQEGEDKDGDSGTPGAIPAPPPPPGQATTPLAPTRVTTNSATDNKSTEVTTSSRSREESSRRTTTTTTTTITTTTTTTTPQPRTETPEVINSIVLSENESSGSDDYNEILVNKDLESDGDRNKGSEFSPLYPSYFDPSRESPILTERVANQPPYIQSKLPKYPITAGKSFRLKIPEDTFGDLEDGGTRNLKLKLKDENGSTLRNSWIGFDEENQIVYALPVDENGIGRYIFRLEAYDKEGLTVSDNLEIVVRQYSGSRLVSHQFSLEFSFNDNSPASLKNWSWKVLEKIGEVYGDTKLSNIIVREVTSNPYVFGWTNDTLTQPNCPKDIIRALYSRLVDSDTPKHVKTMTGAPSRILKSVFGSQFLIKSVTLTYHGTCLHEASLSPFDPTVVGKDAAVPVIRNPVDRINVTAGELLRYKVPEDTCYDEEDGNTPKLNLHLLTTNRRELAPSAWLQFDTRNQEFVGIPLEEEVGREEYQLVCSDRNGLSAIDAIVVIVQNRPFSERFGIEFTLEFKDFSGQRRDTKVKIVESISNYFGDKSTSNVILKSFDVDEAKVVWYNKSLAYVSCEDPLAKWVTHQMLLPDGKIRPRFIQHFEPYLQLMDVSAVKKGSCASDISPIQPSGGSRDNVDMGNMDTIFHGMIPSADYLLTFIIPAVIITCMLILAILLACLLHKKRKDGKLNLFYSESLPPRVPVILQDELFEDQEQGFHKQPILLPEDTRPNMYNPHHPQEMDRLLHQQVNLDFNRAGSLSRPTPAYQRRQL